MTTDQTTPRPRRSAVAAAASGLLPALALALFMPRVVGAVAGLLLIAGMVAVVVWVARACAAGRC